MLAKRDDGFDHKMSTTPTTLPRVHMIVLGGTITMMPQPSQGIVPKLSGADLVAAVPALAEVATISVETPFLIPGASISLSQLRGVSQLAQAAIENGASGVVVVQGTDTIDETAFALDLAHDGDAPIVVTGAMRGADAPGADGPANLLAAVLTACSAAARGLGALVVLNDEIHAARFVEKSHKALVSAFTSPAAAPLGTIIEGAVRIALRPDRLPLLGAIPEFERVAIVKLGLGDDGTLIEAAAECGFAGLVIEGMGAGHVPAAAIPALENVGKQLPLVLASRVPSGPIFERTYGFAGSELDLLSRGLVPAGSLSATKARLLLGFLLGQGRDRVAIADIFRLYR